MKKVKMGMGSSGESEHYLTSCMQMTWLCGKSEEELKAMMGCFVEVCSTGMKVNAGKKSKMMVLNREKGLQCEVSVDGVLLEHVPKFN